jgi:hypothetical protein
LFLLLFFLLARLEPATVSWSRPELPFFFWGHRSLAFSVSRSLRTRNRLLVFFSVAFLFLLFHQHNSQLLFTIFRGDTYCKNLLIYKENKIYPGSCVHPHGCTWIRPRSQCDT